MKYVAVWHLILVLKARQEGVSTFFLIYHLDRTLFTPNCTKVILAHRRDSLQMLFRIIKIAYESCPDRIRLEDGRIWTKAAITASRRRSSTGMSRASGTYRLSP